MKKLLVKDEFYLDDKPLKIISGAIHYFRVVPEYWRDRLEKLKGMGCNTVETYVAWNIHEPREGEFDFEGICNLRKFIQIAHELELYVILRPSPYICAEWEFGGLPSWLLTYQNLKLRMSDAIYMSKVKSFMMRLLKEVVDLQIDDGGPIILMQVENEYGGYANDLNYLRDLAGIMKEAGVVVPLVTSDGPWHDMLINGSIPELALPTMNCGSKITEHFRKLEAFHGEKKPLMVMEFWIGWFDAWGDAKHHTTDIESAASELDDILKEGSVNIYMFHGGTNFGFMNGANYYEKLAPDTTSYDYDALLTEWGDVTPKYRAFQEIIAKYAPVSKVPLSTEIIKKAYGTVLVKERVSLFSTVDTIAFAVDSTYPLTMEMLGASTGYVYYTSAIGGARQIEDFRLISVKDRANVFVNGVPLFVKYDLDMEEREIFELIDADNELGILVENMGRVNYSVKMNHQTKGICDGVIVNGAFQTGWRQYALPMDNLEQVDFSREWRAGIPGFYSFKFDVDEIGDTFLDLTGWGKGFATLNGFNLGRFWEVGPQVKLYVPGPLLRLGENELIIFESDGKIQETVIFTDKPDLWG